MAELTWVAAGAGLASDGANWSGGAAPQDGDVVIFDATSVNNCSWDLDAADVTVNSLTLATGYTGTFDQGDVDIGIGAGGYTQQGGTFTGNPTRWMYCDGDAIRSAGTVTPTTLRLCMTGNGLIGRFSGDSYRLHSLTVDGTIRMTSHIYVMSQLVINGDYDLSGYTLKKYVNTDDSVGGSGVVRNGTIEFSMLGDYYIDFDGLTTNCKIQFISEGSYVRTAWLHSSLACDSLTVTTVSPNIGVLIDLASHSLTADSVTVGTNGNILWGEGTHRIGGNLDTSAGASDFETSQVIMTDNGTVKLGAGQAFHDLLCEQGLTLASDIEVGNVLAYVRPIEQGAFSITNDRTKEYTGLRRPLVRPLVLGRVSDPVARPLLEGLVRG